jgi:hypothetical protein
LLLEMRLEDVFLSVRPIVLSLARLTILSSTTFFLKQAKAPFGVTGRGWPTCRLLDNLRRKAVTGVADFAHRGE